MMTTILALLILFGTVLLVLGNLRVVAEDTFSALTTCAARARASGQLVQRSAFLALWLLIFVLSYL
jgi:hypothetical protein